MTKYLINRILRGIISIVCVVAIVMLLIYSAMDRNLIFASDPLYSKVNSNQKKAYMYRKWEEFGYLDYVPYSDYLLELLDSEEIDRETYDEAILFAPSSLEDSDLASKYVKQFTKEYEAKGYNVLRLDAVYETGKKLFKGGQQQLFAYKEISIFRRLGSYFSGLLSVDNIHNVKEDIGERKLTFTFYDPVYGGEKFSPAIIGNGTNHKYLLYFDDEFPFIHQNLVTIHLGKSYNVNMGVDVFETMNETQGSYILRPVVYPTGLKQDSADNLHTAMYIAGSSENEILKTRFVDDYTNTRAVLNGKSKIAYSFIIGIIATALSYLLGIPIGITMAKKKDKAFDKIGSLYIVFISAVPSLAYIFMFKALGFAMGLPTTFNVQNPTTIMYVLPIVSLGLPSVAGLMKWLRRYMIDQMNSDYVKFARSGGLTNSEIFSKHILKNAIIPIVHGIPGSILGAITGAIITERVYVVPGAGNLLITAINMYDNNVIVGVSLFYAVLSVISLILGDVLMAMVDPRISFTDTAR